MKEQDQNIAIHKALGLHARTQCYHCRGTGQYIQVIGHGHSEKRTCKECKGMGTVEPSPIPYTQDLNAIHEAEKTLTENQWPDYSIKLNEISCRLSCGNVKTCGYTISATASQRAEAFLKTLNLWTE